MKELNKTIRHYNRFGNLERIVHRIWCIELRYEFLAVACEQFRLANDFKVLSSLNSGPFFWVLGQRKSKNVFECNRATQDAEQYKHCWFQ